MPAPVPVPGDLTSIDFALAFDIARSEAGSWRDADGAVQLAAPGAPRFDHDADGTPRGLVIAAGADLGGGDRAAIDPLILPAEIVTPVNAGDGDVTIFHRHDAGSGAVRRAWYSRNAPLTINALLAMAGHHLELGVVRGHRANEAGVIHFRGQTWALPGVVFVRRKALVDGGAPQALPLVNCGAEPLRG